LSGFILTSTAKSHLRRFKRYYEAQRPGKGNRFLDEAWQRIQRILLHPYAVRVVEGKVRKAKIPGFKNGLYYFVKGDEIVIFAVMHQRQHPDSWKKSL
jgi:plasmid stabilization system protein ParE